jgi:hypothetical protein
VDISWRFRQGKKVKEKIYKVGEGKKRMKSVGGIFVKAKQQDCMMTDPEFKSSPGY